MPVFDILCYMMLEYAGSDAVSDHNKGGRLLKKIGIALGISIAFVLAIGLFGLLLARPLSEAKLKESGVIEPDSRFLEVDGVSTRYIGRGGGEEAIVFIHGFSSTLWTWRSCLEPFSKQYRIYALDLKGFGFSGKPDSEYTTDEYVDFVIHFMDALELQTATLCGNSMGGNIAWRAALKHPDRIDRLILVDASGYASDHSGAPFFLSLGRLPGVGEILGSLITRGRIRATLESAYHDAAKVTDQTVDAYYYPMRTQGAMHAVLARLRGFRADTEKWQSKIPELSLPTLIIWGENDTWIEREIAGRFHKDISGSKLVVIPECGHLPQEEKPEDFAISVLEFLSGKKRDVLVVEKYPPALEKSLSTRLAAG